MLYAHKSCEWITTVSGKAAAWYFEIFKTFWVAHARNENEAGADELYQCLVDGITRRGFFSFLDLMKVSSARCWNAEGRGS